MYGGEYARLLGLVDSRGPAECARLRGLVESSGRGEGRGALSKGGLTSPKLMWAELGLFSPGGFPNEAEKRPSLGNWYPGSCQCAGVWPGDGVYAWFGEKAYVLYGLRWAASGRLPGRRLSGRWREEVLAQKPPNALPGGSAVRRTEATSTATPSRTMKTTCDWARSEWRPWMA